MNFGRIIVYTCRIVLQDESLDEMRNRIKEMEEEAEKLKEMQTEAADKSLCTSFWRRRI